MRHKRLQLSVILLLGFGLTSIQAQTMYVKQITGNQTHYTVGDIRKMTFSGGKITITKTAGSSDNYSLTGIQYLSFTHLDTGTGIEHSGQENRQGMMQLYPNPGSNYITVALDKANDASGVIEILTLEGRVLISEQIAGRQKVFIDMIMLSKGIYLCRYMAGTTCKTAKIIKL